MNHDTYEKGRKRDKKVKGNGNRDKGSFDDEGEKHRFIDFCQILVYPAVLF